MERRSFIKQGSILGLTLAAGANSLAWSKSIKYHVGIAAITWNGNDAQAIKDIASLGFKGVQLRGSTFSTYGGSQEQTKKLKELLAENKMKVPVFSGGDINLAKPKAELIDFHKRQSAFCKEIGVDFYQFTNNNRPKDGQVPTKELLSEYAKLMAEVGELVKKEGVTPVYHNHMHQLGETPEEVDSIATDLKGSQVKLLLDVAHYTQGGGNAAKAIVKYADQLAVLHLKDVRNDANDKHGYKFVELGQGRVDFKSIFAALETIKFKGWAMVELDAVPEKDRTPIQSTEIRKTFWVKELELNF
jgi:inosose dehydratase